MGISGSSGTYYYEDIASVDDNMMSQENGHRVRYEDVPSQDSEEDEEEDDFQEEYYSDDDEAPRASPRRRRRASPDEGRNFLQNAWIFIFVVMLLVGGALIGWRQELHASHIPRPLLEDDDDDDGFRPASAVAMEGESNPMRSSSVKTVQYDATAGLHSYNPFDLKQADWYGSVLMPPPLSYESDSEKQDDLPLGYLRDPSVVNDTIVFVSEGDMYLTKLLHGQSSSLPAMKLTTTVGNVLSPKINPTYPFWIAYTATYTGRREVYLYDLRPSHRHTPAMRLTYWNSAAGVSHVVGWKDHGKTLVFSASSNEVGMSDTRLYQIGLEQEDIKVEDAHDDKGHASSLQAFQIAPVPLSQAIEGVYDASNTCLYFTRFQQSSKTIRYVGGTVESLWAHCHNMPRAVPITTDYKGTDKSPQILTLKDKKQYLLFLSDRNDHGVPSTMNLWAMPLPTREDLYDNEDGPRLEKPIRLSQVSCEFNGMSLMEYSLDVVTNNVVLRIGADLHILKAKNIAEMLNHRHLAKDSKEKEESKPKHHGSIRRLPIVVYSDFHEHQERILPVVVPIDLNSVDIYETTYGQTSALLSIRGQVFVTPVVPDVTLATPFQGSGMNLPRRKYRVAPGSTMGGMLRILTALHVPLWQEQSKSTRRLSLLLATDPNSDTAEHGFYLVETQSDSPPSFVDASDLPDPFVGGHVNGGSVANGGLGSVQPNSMTVSPCGRRLAWTDTDGRICVMNLPLYQNSTNGKYDYVVLPQQNELGEPMVGNEVELSWSPGGTYLAITHSAKNQFNVVSIADCGSPERNGPLEVADVKLGRIVQATPDRFNSGDVYWGKTVLDHSQASVPALKKRLSLKGNEESDTGATTLYFLSDRNIGTDVSSPWGTRAPSPHFSDKYNVYALPLMETAHDPSSGTFSGGGAAELWADGIIELKNQMEEMLKSVEQVAKKEDLKRYLTSSATPSLTSYMARQEVEKRMMEEGTLPTSQVAPTAVPSATPSAVPAAEKSPFPQDNAIDFGSDGMYFARRAYRVAHIPQGNYRTIVCQLQDSASFVLLEQTPDKQSVLKIVIMDDYPSDDAKVVPFEVPGRKLLGLGLSTTRDHLYVIFGTDMKVVKNSAAGILGLMGDNEYTKNIVDTSDLALHVWPSLEYRQMYSDAWRMLRDYYYDPGMAGVDWPEIHSRYAQLVKRCVKREDLDDVMSQMASEVSSLHVFVYGGEYRSPLHGSPLLMSSNQVATLGATFERSAEWNGYVVTSIPERDPDFNLVEQKAIFSPLSEQLLRLSGQRGLQVGDVIVGVNGESVMRVPDIHMLLRGMVGSSVRLDVLRLASNSTDNNRRLDDEEEGKENVTLEPEPVITVPISADDADVLRYGAWEWKTREHAKELAKDKGFSVGYVHLQAMGTTDEDAFARGFYPDYDKDAFIVDVRHNHGGNIDSWLLDSLQRKAWMYWQSRTKNITTGGLGWDEQFAFRGHLVVLIDEKTSSDGEGFSRGVSELGLGKLIGTRTWGGGIWLSSDNHLVDGGIATAPEVGTYNDNFGWGLGIEQMGVEPDIVVDNNPRESYDGRDLQLEHAIEFLAQWLKEEPIAFPENPGPKKDVSLSSEASECSN